jgi:hypothetical protein
MRKIAIYCCLLLLVPAFGHIATAQDTSKNADTQKAEDTAKAAEAAKAPAHYYHLEFVVQELGADGKPVNSRSYDSTVSTDRSECCASIRTGSRVPIITGANATAAGIEKQTLQYQYIDVGVNVDARYAHEVGHQLAMHLTVEVSNLAESQSSANPADPVVRENKWDAPVLIPIGKPTIVFKSEDLNSKGSMQVVVTATLLE